MSRRLSPLQFTTVHLGPEVLNLADVDVSASTGEFNMASLAKAVDKSEVNRVAVEAWEKRAGGEFLRCSLSCAFSPPRRSRSS